VNSKITIIGAGSGAFSLSMIRDICLTPNLAGSTISLMDINADRLEGAYAVCSRYADEIGFDLRIEKTLDRRAALDGADFVINTALAAPHEWLRAGWDVARRYGYDWGASFHVFYDEPFWVNTPQLVLFESIVEDMLCICPQAYHLLVANPVLAGITHLGRKYPEARVIGLCHGFSGVYGVAETLGLDREGLTFEIPGVNHFVWCTRLYHRGRDVFRMIDRWIAEEAEQAWAEGRRTPGLERKTVDLFRRFRAIPIGDTAHWTGASWPLWYHSDDEIERRWHEDPPTGWAGYFRHVKENAEEFGRVAADPTFRVTELFPPKISGEPMIPMIEAIACDIPRVIIANILNSGDFVPGIPRNFEVEIPTLVSRRGVQGIQTGGLPPALLAHVLRDRVAPVNLEIEAFSQGSKELLIQLILLDPWSRSLDQAAGMVSDVLALPHNAGWRGHYR
jgi:alpha-galactosidase